MQDELFPRVPFSIVPEQGRSQPRLWVRRIIIWSKPGEVIRSLDLRPGLNIIWSPDPGSGHAGPIGHGAGKTMFCRMLRYCLGEDSYAPDGQRHRIWEKVPTGRIGAEVMLDGAPWVVVRSLGHRRHDVVAKNGSLEDASREDAVATGLDPLRNAITQSIIGRAGRLFPATIGEAGAWEATLAWMTRDQECRFGHHLEWRDPHTDSGSPVRGRSLEDRLAVVRALIGGLTEAEIAVQSHEIMEDRAEKKLRSDVDRLDWQIGRTRAGLVAALGDRTDGLAGYELEIAHFKAASNARYSDALRLPVSTTLIDLERTRQQRDQEKLELNKRETSLAEVQIKIGEKTRLAEYIQKELPVSRARLMTEGNPVCPICEVPIDKALAEGCGISTATCDLHALQQRVSQLSQDVEREKQEIQELRQREQSLKHDVAVSRQRLAPLDQAVAAVERSSLDQSNVLRSAQRLVDDTQRYDLLLANRAQLALEAERATAQLALRRAELASHREAARAAIVRLSTMFDLVVRELVPNEVEGEVKLDGKGLTLTVKLNGERSTAAIESLKVVAFDLAVLALAIEGHARLPGFLMHDSPREADLGRSIYDHLFEFAKKLESFGSTPLFQYVVTTTTAPPMEFQDESHLRLVIRGAPAIERLLAVDL